MIFYRIISEIEYSIMSFLDYVINWFSSIIEHFFGVKIISFNLSSKSVNFTWVNNIDHVLIFPSYTLNNRPTIIKVKNPQYIIKNLWTQKTSNL